MNDAPVPASAAPPDSSGQAGQNHPLPAPEVTPKAPGVIRRSALILLVLTAVLGGASFPFVVEPWIIGKVHSSLADQGLMLSDDSHLSISLFGGSIRGKDIHLHEINGEQNVFIANDLHVDLAFMESISSGDVVIDKLVVDGLSGSIRRNKNGRIPVLEPLEPTDPGKPTDWLALGQQLLNWYKKYAPDLSREQDPHAPPPPHIPPQAKPATDWPHAVIYEPQPQPGTQWPRVVIHDLKIKGTSFGLPDDSPFDISNFSLTGTHIALRLRPHEVMTLEGIINTTGSGPITLAINRAGGDSGSMQVNAKEVSIKALSDPAITGDTLSTYGTTGTTDVLIDTDWKGWQQTTQVTSQLRDVTMQPAKDAGDNARQLASAINAFGGKPVTWSPTVGGTLYAPVFTDYGIKSLQASAMNAGKDKAIEAGTKQLNKELEKNPDVKNATDKAKDLFKGLGK